MRNELSHLGHFFSGIFHSIGVITFRYDIMLTELFRRQVQECSKASSRSVQGRGFEPRNH